MRDRALDAWLSIVRPVEAIGAGLETALLQRHAIGLSGYEVLTVLAERRGWSPLVELCAEIELSQPRISRLVAQLQEDGLLERVRDENDGRAFQCRLTRKGRRVHAAAAETVAELLAQSAAGPSPIAAMLSRGLDPDIV